MFNNLAGGTLTGGVYTVNGVLGLQNSALTNAANLTLTGASAEVMNTSISTNALQTLTANAALGKLSLQSGQVLTTAAGLSNAGMITVGTGSQLTLSGTYTQTAGTITVDGTITAPTGFALQKGTLIGKGTVASAITSAASVTPGDASTKPGKLGVTGSYTQDSAGTLNISVGGTAAGTFGELAVSNGVVLGGTLSIKLVNGFVPAIGNNFTILTGSAVSGKFATVKGVSINSSEHFQVNQTATSVTLTVVAGA